MHQRHNTNQQWCVNSTTAYIGISWYRYRKVEVWDIRSGQVNIGKTSFNDIFIYSEFGFINKLYCICIFFLIPPSRAKWVALFGWLAESDASGYNLPSFCHHHITNDHLITSGQQLRYLGVMVSAKVRSHKPNRCPRITQWPLIW